jgi:hypothetical protein
MFIRGPPEGAAGVTYAAGVETVPELSLIVELGVAVVEGLDVVVPACKVLVLELDVD